MQIAPLLIALSVLADTSTATSANPTPLKLAVLGLHALEVEPPIAALLSEVALTEAGRFKALQVIGQSDVATMLGHERQRQLLGCQEDSACVTELAGGLGADYLLIGSVGRIGSSSRIDLKLIEVKKARVLARTGGTLAGPQDRAILAVQRGVAELLTPLAGAPAPATFGIPGAASEFDGRYIGLMTCDTIPGVTKVPLRTRVAVKVAGAQAEYERDVLHPDTGVPLGVPERGTGAVAPGGVLTLSAKVVGRAWDYDASYSGAFEGRTARLSGQQAWHLPRKRTFSRPCTIELTRSELN